MELLVKFTRDEINRIPWRLVTQGLRDVAPAPQGCGAVRRKFNAEFTVEEQQVIRDFCAHCAKNGAAPVLYPVTSVADTLHLIKRAGLFFYNL